MTAVKSESFLKSGMFKFLIGIIIAVLIMVLVRPDEYISALGVRALAVIVFTIWMWVAVNTSWSNLLFFALLIMTGVMSPGAVWSGSIGHFAPMLIIVFTIIGNCLTEHGAIDFVASWFITRKIVRGRPYMFIAMFFLSIIFIGQFMQNLALCILFVDLTARVCEKIGVKKGHSLYTIMFVGVLWAISVISIASPIAKTLPNVLIGLMDVQLGITVTYAQWFAIGIPFSIVMFFVIMLCVRIFKPDVTPLQNLDIEEFERNAPPLTKEGKIGLIVMGALVLMILLPDILITLHRDFGVAFLSGLMPLSTYFVRISANALAICALVLLCLLTTKNSEGVSKPIMNFNTCARDVPISMILFIGAVIVMGAPLGNAELGITAWLGNLMPVSGWEPFAIIMFLSVMCIIITNFISIMVVMTLFFNLGIAVLVGTGTNLGSYAVAIAFLSSISVLTPSASMVCPLFFGPEHMTIKNSVKINLVFIALAFIVAIAFIPLVNAIIPAV